MIYLYTGTPGSGKSLHVARVIYYRLFRSCPVITNIPINLKRVKHPECFTYLPNRDLSVNYLVERSKKHFENRPMKEGSLVLIIDEAQMMFNARDWSKQGRDDWNEFFQVHRHYGYDVILIAQFDRMIDRQVRSLVEYEFVHRKVSNYGWKGRLLSILMFAPTLFVSVKKWYPMKEKVDSEFFRYSRKWGGLYDTYMTFEEPKEEESALV